MGASAIYRFSSAFNLAGVSPLFVAANLADDAEYTILSSRKLHFAMVFEVDASSPPRSRRDARTIPFAGLHPDISLRSIAPLVLGRSESTVSENAYLAVLASDGSLHSFEVVSASTDETIDTGPTDSQAAIRPAWSEEIQEMAVDQRMITDQQRDWQDKAASKHKILDLRWVWQGMSTSHIVY